MVSNDNSRLRIIEALNIQEVVQRYTSVERFRHNRCPCPIHNGKDNNFTIYPKTKSFYCFTCGKGGDLIKFVAVYFSMSYSEAMAKLDTDYHLGVFEKQNITQNDFLKKEYQRKRKQLEAQRARDFHDFSYDLLINYFKWLHRQPETAAIAFDIAFIERLLDKHLSFEENPIRSDIKALIAALYTKHKKAVIKCPNR